MKIVPVGMSREIASAYMGLSPARFDQLYKAGRIPRPRVIENLRLWHRDELPTLDREIYVVGFDKFVKIGFSMGADARIVILQGGVPLPLKIYAIFEGTMADERRLHKRFKKYRLNGEWFRLEGRLVTWLKSMGAME